MTRRRSVALVLTVLAAVLAGCATTAAPASRFLATGPPRPLPTEVLAPVTGDEFESMLVALRGKVVVVNVWASWCLACRDEHEALSSVASTYAGRGVRFVGILYNDQPSAGTRWIADMGGQSYASVKDNGARTAIDFGVYGVPETFFIGPDGIVAYKHLGPVTERVLIEQIERIRPAHLTTQ